MSLKAIASVLGLSVTTVSRALNGYEDVAKHTRQRVEEEARRRGYRPNVAARRLKTGRANAVGVVYPMSAPPSAISISIRYYWRWTSVFPTMISTCCC